MKHFRLILTLTRIIVTILFVANVFFMVQLYTSIKNRYLDDVAQSLRRADQIEIVDRIVKSGLNDSDDVVWIQLGLQKSDLDKGLSFEQLAESDYSQGYRRVDKQIISEITRSLHSSFDSLLGFPDTRSLEEAFRIDLGYSGYYPDYVHILGPGDTFEYSSDLWEIVYKINDDLTYYAYISPLTDNILREMSGVIITSVLIALALTFGFWYLLHMINHLRTIEEMKDDFTNNMTHELKTPIAIAYAANDSLLQFPDPQDQERTKRYLTASLEQLSKLAGLVESILAMSMERRKNLLMAKEKIQLRNFLKNIIEQHKLKADKPCEIVLECNDEVSVEADPTYFSNVIGNLIDNSIKYSADTVTIIIRADEDAVSVSDNGNGIPESAIPEIFNKFYRVPQGNTRQVSGYGIGLYYVRSIVEKHGWSINVKSKVGAGSEFTIKFKK